jgi:GNAT superfamily N-acetyltransferase
LSVSDAELYERHTRSHERFYRLFAAATPEGRSVVFDGAVIATLIPALRDRSLPNAVTYRDASMVEPVLSELAQLYESAGISAWMIWVPPGDEHLGPLLAERGHSLDGTPQLMGATIGDCDLSRTTDIEIGDGSSEEIGALNDIAWGHDRPTYRVLLGSLPEETRRFVARDADGTVLGTTLAIHVKGDCYITFVATSPQARGRGIASDLVKAALRDGLEAGCVTTTLEASAMGRSAYRRIGFRELGQMQMWERRTPSG